MCYENNEDIKDVSSSCESSYLVEFLAGISSNKLITAADLLDTVACPNVVNKESLPANWQKPVNLMTLLRLRKASHKIVQIEGKRPLLFQMATQLKVSASEYLKSLAVDLVLVTSFIHRYIQIIFHIEKKVDPWQFWPVTIILTKPMSNSVYANFYVFNWNTTQEKDRNWERPSLCWMRQMSTYDCTTAAVFVWYQAARFMKRETNRSVEEHQCSVTATGAYGDTAL